MLDEIGATGARRML